MLLNNPTSHTALISKIKVNHKPPGQSQSLPANAQYAKLPLCGETRIIRMTVFNKGPLFMDFCEYN